MRIKVLDLTVMLQNPGNEKVNKRLSQDACAVNSIFDIFDLITGKQVEISPKQAENQEIGKTTQTRHEY